VLLDIGMDDILSGLHLSVGDDWEVVCGLASLPADAGRGGLAGAAAADPDDVPTFGYRLLKNFP
jgi:hypothetical protein